MCVVNVAALFLTKALVNQFPFLETLNISSNALDSLDDVVGVLTRNTIKTSM